MIDKVTNILTRRFPLWHSSQEKRKLTELLIIWLVAAIATLIYFFIELISNAEETSVISYYLLGAMNAVAIIFTLNGRTRLSVYTIFALPLVLYAFYTSDFSLHLPENETIYIVLAWLVTGQLLLQLYAESNSGIILYYFISIGMLSFQLSKAGDIAGSFIDYKPFVSNPLITFSIISVMLFAIRNYFRNIIQKQKSEITVINQGVSKVLQESSFSIAQIRAERDEEGNIVSMIIEKVNNAFEATFKINLYEVQEQKADYIFNLILKGKFDINRYIYHHQKNKKAHEFHAAGIEKWFNVHVLQPDYYRFYIAFEDITRAKEKLAELEESKRRYKVLLEAIPDMFFVIDKDGTYEDFVVKESSLFKVEDANIIGSSIYEVGFPENMAGKVYACIQSCLHSNSIETIEY